MERKYIAILIEGDNENTLGGACSRDIWHIVLKIINELKMDKKDIFTFFHNPDGDPYVKKLRQNGLQNISQNSLSNIQNCFYYVSSMENTIIIYHYSGHGFEVADTNGDEIDGRDEAFLSRSLTDDFIWNELVSKLPASSHIFSTIDACHSGSGMDLPYIWKDGNWKIDKKKNLVAKCTGFSISACNDSECAQQDIGETTGFSGSLTAGICDCGRYDEMIFDPMKIYQILVPRLKKLGQTVELYKVK